MVVPSILKEPVTQLDVVPWPEPDTIREIRVGKVSTRGLGSEPSAIHKLPVDGRIFASKTGFTSDEHQYGPHGGTERAINQYDCSHYADWRQERPNQAKLFTPGGFGENLVGEGKLSESNVCIGDIFRVSARDTESDDDVILEVSEPRNPCYKLNIRFESPTTLNSIVKTGRTGWNMRVLREGFVEKGDVMTLMKRPNPRWSAQNVQKVLHGRTVEPSLIEEIADMEVITQYYRDLAVKRMATASRRYKLVEAKMVTSRVKQLTFELAVPTRPRDPRFKPFANAQIKFGPNNSISRSYSIVSGDLTRFTLGVALDDLSRGGSRYIHETLKLGDQINMAPGLDGNNAKKEELCMNESVEHRIVVIGGIGVTAFLPVIKQWTEQCLPFEIHYAVRSQQDAAFKDILPSEKTTFYSKAENHRLDIAKIIPGPNPSGRFPTRIFCCGPQRLMDACQQRATELGYPNHMLHFESFGTAKGGELGPAFDVDVTEPDSGRKASVHVPPDKTLLEILRDAGFDVMSSCQAGGCGSCKVQVNCGAENVQHNSDLLKKRERESAMLSCVDRAVGRIQIEVD